MPSTLSSLLDSCIVSPYVPLVSRIPFISSPLVAHRLRLFLLPAFDLYLRRSFPPRSPIYHPFLVTRLISFYFLLTLLSLIVAAKPTRIFEDVAFCPNKRIFVSLLYPDLLTCDPRAHHIQPLKEAAGHYTATRRSNI